MTPEDLQARKELLLRACQKVFFPNRAPVGLVSDERPCAPAKRAPRKPRARRGMAEPGVKPKRGRPRIHPPVEKRAKAIPGPRQDDHRPRTVLGHLNPDGTRRPPRPSAARTRGDLPPGTVVRTHRGPGIIVAFVPAGADPNAVLPERIPTYLQGGHAPHHATNFGRYCVAVKVGKKTRYHFPKAFTVEKGLVIQAEAPGLQGESAMAS